MTHIALGLPRIVDSVVDAFARYRKRLARRAEIQSLGALETDRIAHDMGLSSSDLVSLATSDDNSADLMNRRLAQSRISVSSIDPTVLRDMQRCCTQCTSKRRCTRELDSGAQNVEWPDYCPNQQTAETLKPGTSH